MAFSGTLTAQTTGSIDGTVRDPSGAVVPKASVVVVNEDTKDRRTTTSNGQGDFSLQAIQPGTYDLTVTSKGFDAYRVDGIEVHPGDHQNVTKISLKVGAITSEVVVTASSAGVELNSPEKSSLITADDIKRLSTVGRDATELIKFLPGFAVSTGGGLGNVSTANSAQNMGFGSSSVSSFSANGATPQTGATTVVSDGASTMDPGDQGASIQNVNMDMVQEIKVQTSNFGADSAKGPVVINAVGKSGGAQFHGTAYLFARNGVLNANDWYSNYISSARPPTSYYYPGGNIGGPILIPGTNFNRNKKLRFFAGGEVYKQTLYYGLLQSFIPTQRMLSGDLTPPSIAAALNVTTAALATVCPNFYTTNGGGGATLNGSGGICSAPGSNGTAYTQQDQVISQGVVASGNGLLPVDPRALIYAKFWPAPNRTPQAVPSQNLLSDGYNYVNSLTNSANGYQLQGRVDDDFTDSFKLNVTYKFEKSNYQEPVKNEYYAGSDIIPYPTPEYSQTKSNGINLNLTKTFGPTLTNEFLVNGVLYNQPANFANPGLVQDSNTGWTGGRYYNNGAHQLPGIVDYENGVPDFAMAYDPPGTGKFLHKFSYNVGDNLTKQIRSHTLKSGVYFETSGNNQLPYAFTQGENSFNHYQSGCATNDGLHISQLQNNVANFLQGCSGFSQNSSSTAANLRYRTADFYVTDEWKTTRKLTLTLGMRFDHLGAWYNPAGIGMAVWTAPMKNMLTPLLPPPNQSFTQYPGISSSKTNSSVPISGQPTRPMFYSPRVGLAYDLYGDGKTTLRGGWGVYRFHDSYNDSAGALGTTLGIQNYTTPNNISCTFDQLAGAQKGSTVPGQSCLAASGAQQLQSPFTVYALDAHDDKQPVTYNYNFTVDQVLPGGGNLEMSYVGNQSHDTFTAGNLSNQNYIPIGGLFQPDPLTGAVSVAGSSQQVIADYRPYPNYTAVYVPNHIGYGNYNGLQVSYEKRKGAFVYRVNYTWSKALGIRGDYRTGAVGDPSNLRNNYGYLGFNRNNIVNATYSWQLGNLYKGNHFVAHLVNQWEISGITGLQSGPDIAVLTGGGNFGLSANVSYTPPGATTAVVLPTGNTSFLGTPDITLQPIVTCDPRQNLHANPKYGHQYINGSCFALPQYGSNGTFSLPDVHGPAYFNSDLTLQRSFRLREKQNLQFRIAGFNFLNHPLYAFTGGSGIGLNLGFAPPNSSYTTPQAAFAAATQQNANFGYTPYKSGYRIVELGVRYNF